MFKRLVVMLALVVAMLATAATAFAGSFQRDFSYWSAGRVGFGAVTGEANLGVRSGPGNKYDVLEVIPKGAIVWMPNKDFELAKHKRWVEVCTEEGQRGWVDSQLLERVVVNFKGYNQPVPLGTVYGYGCNLHNGVSLKCGLVGKVTYQDSVYVLATVNGWLYVVRRNDRPEYDIGTSGWIKDDYVVEHEETAPMLPA